jgi:integrase/recombinase XerD
VGSLTDIVRQSATLEAQTRSVYLQCVRRFESFAPDQRIWSPQTVERWRDALLSQSLQPQTVNKHLYALRYASRRREALGRGQDFARAAESAKAHRGKLRSALTLDEVESMIATCTRATPRDLRDRALLTLAVKTGLRVSGLQRLTWDEIHATKVSVILKGGRSHAIYLDDETHAALDAWKKCLGRGRPQAVFVSIHQKLNDKPSIGKSLSRQSIHAIFAERGKAAGIKRPIHPHLLRHTFVTWALAAGVPVQRVMVMTGHRSLGALSGYVTDLDAQRDPVGGYLPTLNGKKK